MATAEVKQQLRLKNILVTTDFSEASGRSLTYAVDLTQKYRSKIIVLHVIEPEPFTGVPLDPLHRNDPEEQLQIEQKMSRFAENRMFAGLQHQVLVRRGPISDVIKTAVKENDVDLIVLATHGRTGITHLVIGSVAEQIFRSAVCPVITIGPKAAAKRPGQLRKVMYATDFSESAERALPYAVELARNNGATLIALHIGEFVFSEGIDLSPQLLADSEKLLREKVHPPEDLPDFQYLARLGTTVEGILSAAAEQEADLIVMGLHRHSAMSAHLPWATAHRIVAHASCPVLTVR